MPGLLEPSGSRELPLKARSGLLAACLAGLLSCSEAQVLGGTGVCPTDWRAFFTQEALTLLVPTTSTRTTVTATTLTTTSSATTSTSAAPSDINTTSITSATATTTSATTSTTRTGTSTTRSQTTTVAPVTTTFTTSTSTSKSRTTATETLSSTSRTSTSTTTKFFPCSICPLYHFIGCDDCVAEGRCLTLYSKRRDFNPDCEEAYAPGSDACIAFRHSTLSCPSGNELRHRAVEKDEGEYPLIRCRVCAVSAGTDTSMYRDRYNGTVSWGPNQFDSMISESSIDSYRVYLADAQLRKVGPIQAIVEAKQWANQFTPGRCDEDIYQADLLDVPLPAGTTYIMVVPYTRSPGNLEMNVGPVAPLIDLGTKILVASGANPSSTLSVLWPLLASAAFAWSL